MFEINAFLYNFEHLICFFRFVKPEPLPLQVDPNRDVKVKLENTHECDDNTVATNGVDDDGEARVKQEVASVCSVGGSDAVNVDIKSEDDTKIKIEADTSMQ